MAPVPVAPVAQVAPDLGVVPEVAVVADAGVAPDLGVAPDAAVVPDPGVVPETGFERGSAPEPIAAADVLEQATDEEIGIALDYETLAGFDEPDVIEQLDLLERLAALAERKRG